MATFKIERIHTQVLIVCWLAFLLVKMAYMKSLWQLILKILQKEVFSLYLKVESKHSWMMSDVLQKYHVI